LNKLSKNLPEILAPAGDFSTAIRAFEAGADAVYLGLKDFSARKGATNFDYTELRRLKNYVKNNNKAFYVTLNTIIEESEFEAMHSCLSELELIGPNALIIQDFGLLYFIKNFFPKLVIHASTQMAIHNSGGLKMAKALGIERVVLSRELSFEQIKALRLANPDIELEVFIHGALCYSFSGLCLASGLLLERSGNRGSCAQLCRNFYKDGAHESYPFSCNDLALQEEILKLKEIGIHSFKIEGRLKSKEYVQSTVRLYRSILNGEKNTQVLKDEAALNFARKQSSAYFSQNSGRDLIDPLFPGHRGIFLGLIEKIKGSQLFFKTEYGVNKNDTFLILNDQGKFTRFTAFKIKSYKNDVEIHYEDSEGVFSPKISDQVFLIHSSKQVKIDEVDSKKISEEKSPLSLKCIITDTKIVLKNSFANFEDEIVLQEAQSDKDFKEVFAKIFREAGASRFCFHDIELINESKFKKLFIPLSQLKKIKNSFYELTEKDYIKKREMNWTQLEKNNAPQDSVEFSSFSDRLSFYPEKNIPFAHLNHLKELTNFKIINGFRVIPLLPILTSEDLYYDALEKLIEKNPHEKFILGLSNLGHFSWAKKQSGNLALHFFADFYIYNANQFSLSFLKEEIPKLHFAYAWVEKEVQNFSSSMPMIKIKDKEKLPYFISLGCFEKHNMLGGKCPLNCQKKYSHTMKNGANSYVVTVKDCITYMSHWFL